jgi:two-component system phosphate regulon sensor histidine kinase PhoR
MLARLIHRVRRRIAIKLTLTLVGFVAVTSLAAGLYLEAALDSLGEEFLEARLATAARVVAAEAGAMMGEETPRTADAFAGRLARSSGARVTLIRPDGRVVADSERPGEAAALESHADRPEVRAALGGGVGRAVRRSATLQAPLLYVAIPVGPPGRIAGALRLAVPASTMTVSQRRVREVMLAGGVVALLVALGIGLFVAGRVTRPVVDMQAIARRMSEGDFSARAPVRSPDEIGTLGRSLNVMAARLRDKIQDVDREQAKATAIVDGMVEGVIAVDGHDHILLMNERARALFRVAPSRGERRPFLEVVRNADLHEVFSESRRVPEGSVVRREIALAVPAQRIVQVHAVPLRLAATDVGVVMVLHDVTELRRLEQIRTEFVANVSHELRTPLTAIHGYIETLLGGALDEPEHARRFLEIAYRHTERMGRLIDDLTDLSNIELGRIKLRMVPVDLPAAVDAALAIIRPRAQAGTVAVTSDLPGGLPAVQADPDRLAQILINLVDNAVKCTPAGGSVCVRATPREGGRVEVAVEDTGVGIPAVDLPRVTERFYRVDKARSRELGGTGLGLAIVKHLVLAHGGDLRIESELGRGTRVRFTLLVAERGVPASPA